MNIVDLVIVVLCIAGIMVGLMRGFLSEVVSFLGFFVVIVLAFVLKNPLSAFLYNHLPFFDFFGVIKGVTVLNIALYEIIAFTLLLIVFTVILKIVLGATNIIETLTNMTVILMPLNKLGGAIVGFIESFTWIFIISYILSMPVFNFAFMKQSQFVNPILEHTPVLSSLAGNVKEVVNDFLTIKDKYEVTPDSDAFNKETLDIFLKYKVVSIDAVDNLISKNKIKISNIDEVLNKYRSNEVSNA